MRFNTLTLSLTVAAILAIFVIQKKANVSEEKPALTTNAIEVNPTTTEKTGTATPQADSSSPASQSSSTEKKDWGETWQPTGDQALVLEKAQRKQEEWEKKRVELLDNDLGLSDLQINHLSEIRARTGKTEEALLNQVAMSAEDEVKIRNELEQNRLGYESDLKTILGKDGWKTFVSSYSQHFSIANADRISPHLPMK